MVSYEQEHLLHSHPHASHSNSRPEPLHIRTQTLNLRANPRARIHVNPIRARPLRHSRRDPLTREAQLLENTHIPRAQPSTPQQHSPADLERAVDGADLCRGFRSSRREPVHAVHQHGDGQAGGLHAGEDFAELVGVDAQVVERGGGGEAGVGFGGEVGWMAFGGVVAWRVVC